MAPNSQLLPRFKVAALNSSVLACISHLIRNIHYLHITWLNSKESVIIYQANTMHLEIVCILIYTIDSSATRTPTYSLETQLLPQIPPQLLLVFPSLSYRMLEFLAPCLGALTWLFGNSASHCLLRRLLLAACICVCSALHLKENHIYIISGSFKAHE